MACTDTTSITIDYTKREFTSNYEELVRILQQRFPQDWTDFFNSNIGVALLHAISYDFSLLSFMLDKQANESYLETAQLRANVLRIANQIGYQPSAATASSISVNAELTSPQLDPVTITKGTEVKTLDGLVFEVSDDYVIAAGDVSMNELLVDADPAREVTFVQGSINITFNGALPTNVGIGASLRATTGADTNFYQIVEISSDRLTAVIDLPWSVADTVSEYEIYNQQITLSQGESKSTQVVSNGTENQSFTTPDTSAIQGSVSVFVDGVEWTEVESLILSDAGQDFEVSYDDKDRAIIRFGDGIIGAIPPNNAVIDIYYRVGGGSVGNIARSSIRTTINGFIGVSGTVQVFVTNPANVGSGGEDRETIEHIKIFAPRSVRTNDRAVTGEDYQTLSSVYVDDEFGAVARAVAVLDTNLVPLESNIVRVYIWGSGDDNTLLPPSDGLRASLKEYLDTKKMIGTEVLVVPGVNKEVDVNAALEFDDRFDTFQIIEQVEEAIDCVFQSADLQPGTPLYISKLYEAVESVQGVRSAYITTDPVDDQGKIPTEKFETIAKGNIEIVQQPVPPDFLAVPATSTGTFTAIWGAVAGIDGYELQESPTSDFVTYTTVFTGNATEFTMTRASGTYYYRVRTYNSYGNSDYRLSSNGIIVT